MLRQPSASTLLEVIRCDSPEKCIFDGKRFCSIQDLKIARRKPPLALIDLAGRGPNVISSACALNQGKLNVSRTRPGESRGIKPPAQSDDPP